MRSQILALALVALLSTSLVSAAPCAGHKNGGGGLDVDILSGNGKNSGIISSGNDNGFHQGDNSSYESS
ncbi:hypothetical protein BDZ90DRAFT_230097 [Jaminaea rosea]|uniref:Uncharacterized protein n=1 Tax=Jaminaea rosea TaxID=1569628 RepID=A0A316V266_9BASI|nr:hypothetical protein BDZ90DRAFT_230097 [Jaminaea rosea]PWN31098.1 hypothetical protein BDZ90DRAFT_230097 [Jaminaea rosea]